MERGREEGIKTRGFPRFSFFIATFRRISLEEAGSGTI